MFRNVNGNRIKMTAKEVDAFEATRGRVPDRPSEPTEVDILKAALKSKGALTDTDLEAAKQKLIGI